MMEKGCIQYLKQNNLWFADEWWSFDSLLFTVILVNFETKLLFMSVFMVV